MKDMHCDLASYPFVPRHDAALLLLSLCWDRACLATGPSDIPVNKTQPMPVRSTEAAQPIADHRLMSPKTCDDRPLWPSTVAKHCGCRANMFLYSTINMASFQGPFSCPFALRMATRGGVATSLWLDFRALIRTQGSKEMVWSYHAGLHNTAVQQNRDSEFRLTR